MTKYGSWRQSGWGTGIALPATLPDTPPRVHPPPRHDLPQPAVGQVALSNMVVGLKSVAQLSLWLHFSVFQGITEGYNLLRIDISNNH